MNSALEEMIENVLETKFETLSDDYVHDAKMRIIDIIGCAVGGANAPGNSMILEVVRDWGGKKEATVLAHGDRVPVHHAAMVNSIMCRSYDYEACLEAEGPGAGRMTGHICGTTEPTGLAVAEQKGSDGKELIAAVIIGADFAARIITAEDWSLEKSFDPAGTGNAFGAVAVTGKLWGLNHHQMLNAFGILVCQIAGTNQVSWDGVHAFKLAPGFACRDGIFSVELASKGFGGIKDPLFSSRGYFAQYCESYRPELLTVELGKRFYTKGSHKPYPCCAAIHTAIECGLEMHRCHEIDTDEIEEITLFVPPMLAGIFLNQPFRMGDTQMKASFNLPYNVANVILRKSIKLDHFTDEFLQDPKVVKLADKVKIVPRQQTDSRKGGWAQDAWATSLEVLTRKGQKLSSQVKTARGRLDRPLTMEEVKDKYRENIQFSKTVSREKSEEALKMLENLEEIRDVGQIIKLLVA